MKKNIKTILALLFIAVLSFQSFISSAQKKDTSPALNLPEIDYKPSITNGWVGQYVYELHFNGKSSLKTAKGEVPYYRIKTDRIHTGYVEFPTEIRGAIRSNQPDKYNKERYESWIRKGSSKSWSKVVDTIKTIQYTGRMGDIVHTGTMETNYARNSNGSWIEGWLSGCDMQIDHTAGLYSFSLPAVAFEIEEDIWGVETSFKPEKKEPFQQKNKVRLSNTNTTYLHFDVPEFITDTFQKGQKEIVIRKRIPVLLQQTTTQGTKDIKLPAVKGFMDFYLVLKKAPFEGSTAGNKSASVNNPQTLTEQSNTQANEKNTEQQTNTKKAVLNGVKKKVNNIISNR
jgi:hypothetical protein